MCVQDLGRSSIFRRPFELWQSKGMSSKDKWKLTEKALPSLTLSQISVRQAYFQKTQSKIRCSGKRPAQSHANCQAERPERLPRICAHCNAALCAVSSKSTSKSFNQF